MNKQLKVSKEAVVDIDQQKKQWMTKVFIIGGIVGGLAGLIGAFVFIQNKSEKEDHKLDPATGVQLGLGILGVLRLLTK